MGSKLRRVCVEGRIPDDGLVRWVVWEELYTSPASILSDRFVRAYNLGIYREWMQEIQEQHIELENLCQRIVEFGKVLAGLQDDLLFLLIELILRPGILFWGFETESSEDIIKQRYVHSSMKRLCRNFLDNIVEYFNLSCVYFL
jgi:hypothetical protein